MIRTAKRSLIAIVLLAAVQSAAGAQDLSIRVDLSDHRLDVYRGGERIESYETTVGSPGHPTPTGTYTIGSVEWNPWWNPPSSPWASEARRTPPGPDNPMGRAKMQFRPLYYVHGSSGELGRAASHGCIRISNSNALALARLLARETGANITEAEIDALERNSSRTRKVTLPRGVPVEIRH